MAKSAHVPERIAHAPPSVPLRHAGSVPCVSLSLESGVEGTDSAWRNGVVSASLAFLLLSDADSAMRSQSQWEGSMLSALCTICPGAYPTSTSGRRLSMVKPVGTLG